MSIRPTGDQAKLDNIVEFPMPTSLNCLAVAGRHFGIHTSAAELVREYALTGEQDAAALSALADKIGLELGALPIAEVNLPDLAQVLPAIVRLSNGNAMLLLKLARTADGYAATLYDPTVGEAAPLTLEWERLGASISEIMRGSVATGSGNDMITVTGKNDGAANNLMTISAGNGTNSVSYSGTSGNRAAIITGSGADTITFSGQANGAIDAGAGNDRVNVRSTGNVSLTGGAGLDVFSFIAGAHATIADFKLGEDRIEFSGMSAANVQVRNNGTSTLIDFNGASAVVLSGVALNASQLNLSYV